MDSDHSFMPFGASGLHVPPEPERSPLRRTLQSTRPARPQPEDPVFIRDHRGLQRVDRTNIGSLRAEGNYVEVHTPTRRYVLRNSLCEVVAQLGHHCFAQVNRNTAVNIHRLERVDADSVKVDGHVFTLSRSFRRALIERIRVLGGR